ncbi:hypothetical protein NYZ99_04295 [Maribacter litopenaei]|uniref:Polymerase/histidinol phosphatase N-terminal domain-containing protein n=1 Tax=Maribacter litopenaei TaxID=2976127 RepID=A0ABY5Y9I3_9FLAO|nr:hypothetical protein [Maribacter litopenaei]UWX55676.1 hypothetical protein NYZ99_04295 [Maribacter litopenaei]
MKSIIPFFFLFFTILLVGQEHTHRSSRPLTFPDIPGYKSIKTDLHMHTVFSDGNVWPNIRVQEALRDNLDVISLTEHLEYQPHSQDIPHPDRNRSYEIALKEAADYDLLIVHGSEITRSAPMGHNNAVFIDDANPILQEKAADAFTEAKKQGAFVFGIILPGTPKTLMETLFSATFKKNALKMANFMVSRLLTLPITRRNP